MKRLRIITLCMAILALGIYFYKQREPATVAAGDGLVINKEWLATNTKPRTAQADVRPADQTFLTFPEWYLVFSPQEQAAYFKQHTSTDFPYTQHISQIWDSYGIVKHQIKGNFAPNTGYHFMIWVIGTSATIEYGIKSWYETVIGETSDTKEVLTEEDKFNADYTQAYVDFIKDRPWYEFDFTRQLKNLWSDISFLGSHPYRKIERRYMLTTELLVKIVYGKLIGLGTQTVYEEALPTTAVILDKVPQADLKLQVDSVFADSSALVKLFRYDKFGPAALELAKEGYAFKEIAGNTSAILLTVLVPATNNINFEGAQTVFTQRLTSAPETKRIALAIPVGQLHTLLKQVANSHVKLEHVFDY